MLKSHNDSAVIIAENTACYYIYQVQSGIYPDTYDVLSGKDLSFVSFPSGFDTSFLQNITTKQSKILVAVFTGLMNEKAVSLGCTQTHFITPNGLDAEDESGVHSTTAEDLAKIMQYCIMTSGEKEAFLEVTRTKEYQFQDTDRKRTFSCHNHNAFLDMMDGALSGKTGFTAEAGYCYVGSLRRDERTFIVALLACGWPDNKGYKWKDTRRLMEYGLEHYHYREVYRNTVPDKLLVVDAFDPEIPYQTSEKISLRVKNSEESKKILLREEEEIRMEIKTVKCKKAPVKKGEKAGTVSYYLADEKNCRKMWL